MHIAAGLFFQQSAEEGAEAGYDSWPPKEDAHAAAAHKVLAKGDHPLVVEARDRNVKATDAAGLHTQHKCSTADGTWELLQQLPGFNGGCNTRVVCKAGIFLWGVLGFLMTCMPQARTPSIVLIICKTVLALH